MEMYSAPFEHELRNCLATIHLTLECLKRHPDRCSSKSELIDCAVRSADRIAAAVRDEHPAPS